MGDNSDKKKIGSAILPWGIHIWNFKTEHARFIRYGMHQILFRFFQRGITPEREITWTRKKMCVKYFSMRNPYMKFQILACTVLERTDACTHNPKPICPVNFFEVGGKITANLFNFMSNLFSWYLWGRNYRKNKLPQKYDTSIKANETRKGNKKMSCLITKPTIWPVCPRKTQISLGFHPVWSESSLCALRIAKDPRLLHADSKDSDPTEQKPGRSESSLGAQSFCWFCHEAAQIYCY